MASGAHASVLFLLLFVSSAASALDIVEILQPFPEYSTFTKYLTQTKVADEINRRKTITVLVVNNSAISPISSLSGDALKNAISVHVILDYYDPYTLDNLPNKTALLTTLFQASGHATDRLGFLNYTELPGERMVFGSAAPGAPLDSELDKVVAVQPYDISVLGISAAIVPSGAGSVATTLPTRKLAPAQAPTTAPKKKTSPGAPVGAPKKTSPGAPVGAPKSSPVVAAPVEGPAGSTATPTGAPKSSPTGAAPMEGPTGSAAAPADDKNADADTPSSHAKSTEAPSGSDKPSSATRTVVAAFMGLVMGVVVLVHELPAAYTQQQNMHNFVYLIRISPKFPVNCPSMYSSVLANYSKRRITELKRMSKISHGTKEWNLVHLSAGEQSQYAAWLRKKLRQMLVKSSKAQGHEMTTGERQRGARGGEPVKATIAGLLAGGGARGGGFDTMQRQSGARAEGPRACNMTTVARSLTDGSPRKED
ncbi:hypothetical protein B296_00022827 [Ensete ventricosum]|uniref:FAS1 domain-containing protein n=1 Tax=Ensete ventricosum TaxID=4639 RepID=A0A426ZFI2_ENSVE|nr:hypothetical protein B296_00022827 [Ensete ventricosum]